MSRLTKNSQRQACLRYGHHPFSHQDGREESVQLEAAAVVPAPIRGRMSTAAHSPSHWVPRSLQTRFLLMFFFFFFFFFDKPCLRFIAQTPQEDPSPGVHQSFYPHVGRQASTVEPSQGPGHLWEHETEPELEPERGCICSPGLGLGLGLWSAEPETHGNASTGTFPSVG